MNEHPVWTVYDELRTAKLNVYYYASRLARARRWHTTRELIMALSGSTGVAGIWFFATEPGSIVWKGLATASALLAVYHSVTRPSEGIRKLETHVTGWLSSHMLSPTFDVESTNAADMTRRCRRRSRPRLTKTRQSPSIL